MGELQMVKSIIRSCLVSKSEQLSTVGQLHHDYKEMEGEYIPFKRMGFDSLHDFLLSIPDTVRLPTPSDRSYQATVRVVTSEKTAHVESLVQRQSSNSKRRSRPSRSGRGVRRGFVPYTPSAYGRTQQRSYQRLMPTLAMKCNQQRTPPQLHNQVRQAMRPLSPKKKSDDIFIPDMMKDVFVAAVRQHPGLTLEELEVKVNVILFVEVSEVYKSIDDVVKSISELRIDNGEVYLRENHANSLAHANSPRILPAGEEDRFDDPNCDYFLSDDESDHYGASNSQSTATMKSPCQGASGRRLVSYPDSDGSECSGDEFLPPDDDYEDVEECRIPTNTVQRILDLLEKEPNGIWCSALADQYQKVYRHKLDYMKSGFVSILQMLLTAPKHFYCQQIDNGDWKVFDASKNNPEPSIPDSTVQRIEELLMCHRKGIPIEDFPSEYEKKFGIPFDHTKMHYLSLFELFNDLSGSVRLSPENGSFQLYATIIPPADLSLTLSAPPEELDQSVLTLFPADVVRLDYEFPCLTVPPFVKQSADIEVIIAAVVNIDRFYVQLRSLEYSKKVDEVEEQMRAFYLEEAGKYRVPVQAVVRGLYCIANINGDYNRLKVIRVLDDDAVTVKYVDYGNTEKINKKMLHFMHKKFSVLPGQAIQCRCANLVPPNGLRSFHKDAGLRLLELVKDKGIVATVSQVFPDRLWMWVSLVDTTGEEDIHINDKLVEEGFATFFRDHITTALLRLSGMSVQEFQNEMEEQKPDPLKDVPVVGYVSTCKTGSVAGSMTRTVTGSIGRSRSVAGTIARTIARSVAGSEQELPLPSRGRRTSPICPPLEELEKSFAKQMVSPRPRSPESPARVVQEVPAASVRPPPGFKALANTRMPADVASILAKQTLDVKATSCNYQNIAISQVQPAEKPPTPDKGTFKLNIQSPEFVPRAPSSSGAVKSESIVPMKLPSEVPHSHQTVYETKRDIGHQKKVPNVQNQTGVPLISTAQRFMSPSAMFPPNLNPYAQPYYNQPQLIPPQIYQHRLPNYNPYGVQPQCQYVQNPFHPQEYLQVPYMPPPPAPHYMPQQPGYMDHHYAREISHALNRICKASQPQTASASSTPPKKAAPSHLVQPEAGDSKCKASEDGPTVVPLDGDNLTDEAKEELLSPDTNTSLDKTLEEESEEKTVEEVIDSAEVTAMEVDEDTKVAVEDTVKEVAKSFDDDASSSQTFVGRKWKAVIPVVMCGKNVLLYNIDGKAFLEVKEVIGLSELKINVALKILKSKDVSRKFNDVKKKTHMHVFEELAQFTTEQLLSVQLVSLQNVVELLAAVNVNINCLSQVEASLRQLEKNVHAPL